MTKMAQLRTYYERELGKEKASRTSGKGGNEVYNSKWPFFNMLHFLRDNIRPRKTLSTMQSIVIDENTQLNEFVNLYKVDNPPSIKSKRKKKQELEDELMASYLKEMKKPKEESTADELWGKYVGQQLTQVPQGYRKEFLKLEIQQLIVKAIHCVPSTSALVELDENKML